jgi:hypothetical protein
MDNHINPFSRIMHPLPNSSAAMPLSAQLDPSGAAVPVAAVVSMFLQLDNNMKLLRSELTALKLQLSSRIAATEAAVGVQQAVAAQPGSSAAAGPSCSTL